MSEEREDLLFSALMDGDMDAIDNMLLEAIQNDDMAGYTEDFQAAQVRYQEEHEMPEEEREQNTAEAVEEENSEAQEVE